MDVWPLSPLLILVPVAVGYGGYKLVRFHSQIMADRYRSTFQLDFPSTITHDAILDFVRSVVGELPRPTIIEPAYAISFEKYADHNGKKYFLHVPGHVRTKVDKLLSKKIDGIGIEPVKPSDDLVRTTFWDRALELTMMGTGAFRVMSAPGAASSIDANFDDLAEDEALVMQWVIIPDGPRKSTPETKDKVSDHTLFAVARIAARGEDAHQNLRNLYGSLRSVNSSNAKLTERLMIDVASRIQRRAGTWGYPIYLNVPEFSALMGWKLSGAGSAPVARKLAPTAMHDTDGIILGVSNHPKYRGRVIAMPHEAGDMHVRVMGATGTGKSTFLLHYGLQAINRPDIAFFLLEPAGDLAWDFLTRIPAHRVKDVIYLDPEDTFWPIGLNPLRGADPERITSHVVSIFRNLSADTWSPTIQRILTASVQTAALLGLTLYDVEQLLVNEPYRQSQLKRLKRSQHPDIFQEWSWIAARHDGTTDSSVVRLKSFLASRSLRNMLSQREGLDFDWIIREHKILIVPLPAARMGQLNASAIGQLVREMAWNAAMKQPMNDRQRSVLILDEFQNFADFSTSKSDPFAEARKYQQQYVIANQYTEQISENVRHTVDKNVASQFVFRLDPEDAKKVKDRYKPLTEEDIAHLPRYTVAGRIMGSQGIAPTVTFQTLPPPSKTGFAETIRANTRQLYARPVAQVEAEILARHKSTEQRRRPKIGEVEE